MMILNLGDNPLNWLLCNLIISRLNFKKLKDTFTHQGMRKKLVKTLEKKGIMDKNVLRAIGKIPRHLFMDSGFIDHAYVDKAFPIAADQTISQPYTVARQTELLEIKKGDKVLEIGTACNSSRGRCADNDGLYSKIRIGI